MKYPPLPMMAVLALAPLGMFASGCDAFFVVEGTLTDCASPGTPIASATVSATVDPTYAKETKAVTTDGKGNFKVHLNKPPSARVSIVFSKSGFMTVTRQYDGIPHTPFRIDPCLSPDAP